MKDTTQTTAAIIPLHPERHPKPPKFGNVVQGYVETAQHLKAHAMLWLGMGHELKADRLIDAAAAIADVAAMIERGE